MKLYIIILVAAVCSIVSCNKDHVNISAPSNVTNVHVEAISGGAIVKWTLPADSNFSYVEIRYMHKGKMLKVNASKYTDSVVITGLLNKYRYSFEVQPVSISKDDRLGGGILTTDSIRPVKRVIEITYIKEPVTLSMVEGYTQETSEGPLKNLIDGDKATFWHSAWSGVTKPLPHWIKMNSSTPIALGQVRYFNRGNGSTNARPNQMALETSDDGLTWTRVWTSATGLNTSNTVEQILQFDKAYTSKYFRVMILATYGNTSYVGLGDMAFYKAQLTDLELAAEDIY